MYYIVRGAVLFIVSSLCCSGVRSNLTSSYYDQGYKLYKVRISGEACTKPGEPMPPGNWSQVGLLDYLTNPCRYNKNLKPPSSGPNLVAAKVYIYFLKANSGTSLNFQAQILLQLKWNDSRLNFESLNTSIDALLGEKYLMNNIWLPHVYMSNERDSLVMGFLRKDDLVVVHKDGLVTFTTRLKSKVSCEMNVGKFPFDVQKCALLMESWRYDSSELMLQWEKVNPVVMQGGINLTEFTLLTWDTSTTFKLQYSPSDVKRDKFADLNKLSNHNYSSLVLTFVLKREYGFYVMEYYIPSVMIVILSWVSFWLTPDALPARINLGSSTMLTFLQLGWTGAGMPKVSQFQYNNIWEVVCTLFIFLTLVEFAFVNTIHRSGFHQVPLKRPTSINILKSSLVTPPKPPRIRVRRSSSCPSSPEIRRHFLGVDKPKHKVIQELSESDFASKVKKRLEEEKSKMGVDKSKLPSIQEDKPLRKRKVGISEPVQEDKLEIESKTNGAPDPLPNIEPARKRKYSILNKRRFSIMPQFSMTNHEIAKWIDEKSRIVFPTAFFLFCLGYWIFLWI